MLALSVIRLAAKQWTSAPVAVIFSNAYEHASWWKGLVLSTISLYASKCSYKKTLNRCCWLTAKSEWFWVCLLLRECLLLHCCVCMTCIIMWLCFVHVLVDVHGYMHWPMYMHQRMYMHQLICTSWNIFTSWCISASWRISIQPVHCNSSIVCIVTYDLFLINFSLSQPIM